MCKKHLIHFVRHHSDKSSNNDVASREHLATGSWLLCTPDDEELVVKSSERLCTFKNGVEAFPCSLKRSISVSFMRITMSVS